MSLLVRYQKGGSVADTFPKGDGGPVFTYNKRPGVLYRKDSEGNWYVSKNGKDPENFKMIVDPSGSRTTELNKNATVLSTTLRRTPEKIVTNSLLGPAEGQVPNSLAPTRPDTKNVKNTKNKNSVEQKYLEDLKFLENGVKSGFKNGKWFPHSSFEGGTPTIAYGHKLQPGEDFSKGLTEAEAHQLLLQDYKEHKNRAKSFIDRRFGPGAFDKLPPQKKVLLTDYEYNLGLNKFPKFVSGLVTNNFTTAYNEYKRYANAGVELTQRNAWTKDLLDEAYTKYKKYFAKTRR